MSSPLTVRGGPAAIVIGEALTQLASRTGRPIDEMAARQWLQAFQGYAADEVRQAFWNFTMLRSHLPTIADIASEIDRLRHGGVSGAWAHALGAAREARSARGTFFVVFEHPAIHFAIEAVGGWAHLQEQVRRADGLSYLRRDFCAAFEDYRTGIQYPAGFGYFDGHNVVLVGHAERAHLVYKRGSKSVNTLIPGLGVLRGVEYLHPGEVSRQLPCELLPTHLAPQPGEPVRGQYPWHTEDEPDVPSRPGERPQQVADSG